MSGHDSAAATQSFTVEVLSVGRRGTKITMPHNWQVIGCDITNDPGGSWIDLVVLQPVSDSTGGES